MKGLIIIIAMLCCLTSMAQVNVTGLHQLVDANKNEFSEQEKARDNQALVTANETVNRTQLGKLQQKYAELQNRYSLISTLVNAGQITQKAVPIVQNIIRHQTTIIDHAASNPAILLIAQEAEIAFVNKARSLINYLIALSAVGGELNQMKASDKFILFNHVVSELRQMEGLSRNLATTIAFNSYMSGLNKSPFSGYVNQDKTLVQDILRNWEMLKK